MMLPLWLLAAHMTGDFVLSNRWQAKNKLTSMPWRSYHVAVYCIPFAPIAIIYGDRLSWIECPTAFLFGLYLLHFLTDSHRFQSTLGDWIHWRFFTDGPDRLDVWASAPDEWVLAQSLDLAKEIPGPLPPNPWTPVTLMIDQSLHILQLAVLAAVFLR